MIAAALLAQKMSGAGIVVWRRRAAFGRNPSADRQTVAGAAQPARVLHLHCGVRSGAAAHACTQVRQDVAATHPAFRLNGVHGNPRHDAVLARGYRPVGHVDLAPLRSSLPAPFAQGAHGSGRRERD
jgi:hypothetical protein